MTAGTGRDHLRTDDDVLLRLEGVVAEYRLDRRRTVHAVSDVSFDLRRGETVGLVGESGCGKSTIGRAIMQHPRPTAGSITFAGEELTRLRGRSLRDARSAMQMIFQDPISSLNPRRTIGGIVGEGLTIRRSASSADAESIVRRTMNAVGLDPDDVSDRRRHQLSGGQCQRVSIARALALEPELVICDEPVASLDVSVQAQILNLLEDMKSAYGLSLLFISHDLAVVKVISDRIVVLYMGKVCEVGPADDVYGDPRHPYTDALLDAVPVPDPEAAVEPGTAGGEPPSPIDPPSGCRFRTRCPRAESVCAEVEPILTEVTAGRFVACHRPLPETAVTLVGNG